MKESTATADRGLERVSAPSRAAQSSAAPFGKNVYVIAMRELRAYFDSLVAYVVLGGSLLGLGIWFFLFQGGFWQVDRATMTRMFEFMPWAFSFLVIPLITMRALAEETRSGTMELLITLPVTDADVILGKYFGALIMGLILIASTMLYPFAIFVWPWHLGALDWGPVWAGYLGLVLFSGAGIAVGLLFSSLTESQIIAFFMTAFVLVFMQIVGWLVQFVPGVVGDSISFVSFASRFEPFSRGLIDTRAVIYFVSVAVLCLLVAFRSLESRKWS